jgi:hypothetical protein
MAKFEDYAKDDLDNEIVEAAEGTETRKEQSPPAYEMPERFKGKTPEEIARSYQELETLSSRQANDLGTMRQTVDELLQSTSSLQEPPVEREPITVDDVYDDPEAAIQSAIEASPTTDRIAKLEQELQQARLQTQMADLSTRHEGWQDTVQSPEFKAWVAESAYRTRITQAANAWDMDAAEEILSLYRDVRNVSAQREDAARDGALQNASLESGTAEVTHGEQTFSRAELMDHRIKAKHGFPESIAYLAQNSEQIAIAYEEGNITD